MNPSLRPMEATWLLLESDDAAMHVGALMIFAIPEGESADFAYRLQAMLRNAPVVDEPWRICLARGATGWRRWRPDDAFDIDYHVRHVPLPSPGGERELGKAVERLHSAALDLRRAPWECHLLSGLHGNRFALYFKVHPALTEATAIVQMLANTLAVSPQENLSPPWSQSIAGWRRGDDGEGVAGRLRGLARVRPLAAAFGRLMRAGGRAAPDLRAPYTAPHLALQVRTGPQRRVATQQYDRARLAAVARAFGATEGELVLYLCATALRRFFREHNALPLEDSLVAALPGQHSQNGTTSMGLVNLGTQHADPHRRLQAIQASLRASREHLQALPPELLPSYTFLATSLYLAGQVTRLGAGPFPMFNLLVSSTYGPETPRWLGASRLEALYPLFPLLRSNALTFDCLRYDGKLHVAVVGARDEIPRLQRLAVYMGQALADLEEMLAAGDRQPAGATR